MRLAAGGTPVAVKHKSHELVNKVRTSLHKENHTSIAK
jgi:hypothetical protein